MLFKKRNAEGAMDSRLIETFLASADQGSFAKAGDILSLTPSNVMRQVNLLEKEVGIALLVRSTKGVILTEAGRVRKSCPPA